MRVVPEHKTETVVSVGYVVRVQILGDLADFLSECIVGPIVASYKLIRVAQLGIFLKQVLVEENTVSDKLVGKADVTGCKVKLVLDGISV